MRVTQFSLHLNMAQECMDIFERDKLSEIAGVEQVPILFSFSLSLCLDILMFSQELRNRPHSRG